MWPRVDADQFRTRNIDVSDRTPGETLSVFYDDETAEVRDVVLSGDYIYLSMLGYLDCIDKGGTRKWRAEYPYSETTVVQIIAVTEDKIFTYHGKSIYCHDLSGEIEWAFTITGTMDGGISSPIYDAETGCVFCGMNGDDGYAVCISPEGQEVWSKTVNYSVSSMLVAEYCYFCDGPRIEMADKEDGVKIADYSLAVSGKGFVGAKLLCYGDDCFYVSRYLYDLQTYDDFSSLICFDKTCNSLWEKELPGGGGVWSHTLMNSIFLSSENAIFEVDPEAVLTTQTDEFKYIVSENDRLYCLNDAVFKIFSVDGGLSEVDSYNIEHYGYARGIALGEYVYIAHRDELYRFDAHHSIPEPPPEPIKVDYELIVGPVAFELPHLEKRVRKAFLVVSKDTDATMYVSTSASDIGVFSAEREIGAGQELDMRRISLPLAQGDPAGGLAYRVRIRGSGFVQVHEVGFDVSARGI